MTFRLDRTGGSIKLEMSSRQVRVEILKMVRAAGEAHLGGPLSSTDLLVALYLDGFLNYHPEEPDWPGRDRFILSCGHYAPAWYAVLAQAGFFSEEKLGSLRQLDSELQGHPSRLHADFVEVSSGSLGQGLSVGVGMGLGLRLQGDHQQVWVMGSDAEFQEGQVWEAVMAAAKFKLGNLQLIVDVNGIQIDGLTDEIMPIKDLFAKLTSFGWHVIKVDGHDFESIRWGYRTALGFKKDPVAILAKTTAGKGVSFMEDKWEWHSGKLTDDQLAQAIKEVENG